MKSVYPQPHGQSTRHPGLALLPVTAVALALVLVSGGPASAARVLLTTEPRTDLRTGPTREHDRVTVLAPGVRLWAEDFTDGFYRVRLAPTLTAWVEQGHVRALERSVARPPLQSLEDISLRGDEIGTTADLRIDEPVAWRTRQQIDPPALVLDLFRVKLAQYGVRQLPTDRTVVVERFRDEIGDWRVCIHSPHGSRVHAPWAMALRARLEELSGGRGAGGAR